jgi:hypothetical protein
MALAYRLTQVEGPDMFQGRTNHRATWTHDEHTKVRGRCEAGDFLNNVARDLGRSVKAVRTRANVLGIAYRPSGNRVRNGRQGLIAEISPEPPRDKLSPKQAQRPPANRSASEALPC